MRPVQMIAFIAIFLIELRFNFNKEAKSFLLHRLFGLKIYQEESFLCFHRLRLNVQALQNFPMDDWRLQ